MPFYNYSTNTTYDAYLASWSRYFTGEPIGPYQGATTLPTNKRLPADKIERHCFVKPSQMRVVKQQVLTVQPLALCKEMPLDLAFASNNDEDDETVVFFPPVKDERTPPPPELTKRKREATPDESSSDSDSDSDSDDDVVRPQKRKRAVSSAAPPAVQTDEQLARQLHEQMNGRSSRRKS